MGPCLNSGHPFTHDRSAAAVPNSAHRLELTGNHAGSYVRAQPISQRGAACKGTGPALCALKPPPRRRPNYMQLVAGTLVSALASPQGGEPYLLIVYKAWGEPRKGVLHLEGVFPEIQLGLGSGLGLRVGLGLG